MMQVILKHAVLLFLLAGPMDSEAFVRPGTLFLSTRPRDSDREGCFWRQGRMMQVILKQVILKRFCRQGRGILTGKAVSVGRAE